MPEHPHCAAAPSRAGESGSVLAFDYGERRIGVAVGDAALGTAHPLTIIPAAHQGARISAIDRLVAEWRPARLVVGIPRAGDGTRSVTASAAERFARQLEAHYRLPVARIDESYSSAEAEQRVREGAGARAAARASRARRLDAHAAQVILEQYFAEHS